MSGILDTLGSALGTDVAKPAIAAVLADPDTQAAVSNALATAIATPNVRAAIVRESLVAGALVGACIAASIWLGRHLP